MRRGQSIALSAPAGAEILHRRTIREGGERNGHAAPGETVNTTYDMKKPEVLACLAANGNIFMDK